VQLRETRCRILNNKYYEECECLRRITFNGLKVEDGGLEIGGMSSKLLSFFADFPYKYEMQLPLVSWESLCRTEQAQRQADSKYECVSTSCLLDSGLTNNSVHHSIDYPTLTIFWWY
jgi:hypothetical protein